MATANVNLSDSTPAPSEPVVEISIGRKRKKGPAAAHPIWDYFDNCQSRNAKQCRLCKKFESEFTTNAERHLLARHDDKKDEYAIKKAAYDEAKNSKASIDRNQQFCRDVKSNQKGETCSKDQLRQLALFTASTSVPFSIIDSVEFSKFCQSLHPSFELPDKKTVLKEMCFIYSQMKKNISDALAFAGRIAICIDEWTKKGMTLSLIGITAHFFNKKTQQLERMLLGLRRIEHPRTAERIWELTNKVLEEWEIPQSKISRFITDNAKNMVKAFHMVSLDGEEYVNAADPMETDEPYYQHAADQNLDESFDEDAVDEYLDIDDFEFFQGKKHLPCFIHTLVLTFKGMVDSVDSEVYEAKRDARRLVAQFSRSAKATERLIDLCGRKLLMPSRTRWNYYYHMLQRLLELRQHVTDVCEEQRIDNVKNWRDLVELVRLLEPFAKWIDYLQGLNYTTIAHALPCLHELLEHLSELKNERMLPDLCSNIISEIKRRFTYILSIDDESFNATFVVATSLHPTLALSLEEPILFRSRQELVTLLRTEPLAVSAQRLETNQTKLEDTESVLCGGLFPHLQKKIMQAKQTGVTTVSSIEEEVNSYFKRLPTYPTISDPLQFWIEHQIQFPTLSQLAYDILAIPASSAAVESVFSVAGHATSGRRHNLSANLEKEVMIKVNKKFL